MFSTVPRIHERHKPMHEGSKQKMQILAIMVFWKLENQFFVSRTRLYVPYTFSLILIPDPSVQKGLAKNKKPSTYEYLNCVGSPVLE